MGKNKYFCDKTFDYPVKDKQKALDSFIKQMFNRTQSMFIYKNLPKTVPQTYLERYLQLYGQCIISKIEGDLYAFCGGFAGTPDVYYNPTQYTISNVALNLYRTFDIDKDCILCKSDSNMQGLYKIFEKYGVMLVENDITIYSILKTARAGVFFSAQDDKTKKECDIFIDKLDRGEMYCIGEDAFFEGVKSHNGFQGSAGIVNQFIELEQYLKASCLNEIGLNANYNMKRESLNTAESALNDDFLIPLIDNMLECRKEFVTKVNELYNTEIEVDLGSAWKTTKLEDMKQAAIAEEDIRKGIDSIEEEQTQDNTEKKELDEGAPSSEEEQTQDNIEKKEPNDEG